MLYRKFRPSKKWTPFVECFYVWEKGGVPEKPLVVESPPSGFCSIVFNYGDPYTLHNKKYESFCVPAAFLAGQSIYLYSLTLKGAIGMAGIVFRPAALGTLFQFPMYEWVEERVNLRLIFSEQTVDSYQEKIHSAAGTEAKAQLLEAFLDEVCSCRIPEPDYLDIAANEIVDKNGLVRVSDLIEKSFTSRRTFERIFFNRVGLSPKFFCRIRRISYICNLIAGKTEVNWAKIYNENDFYDHAHFIRDFEEFVGRSPGQYLRENNELVHLVEKPSLFPLSDR